MFPFGECLSFCTRPNFILAILTSDFQVVLAKRNFHSPWRVGECLCRTLHYSINKSKSLSGIATTFVGIYIAQFYIALRYLSESGPFLAMMSLTLLSPPTGTRSLPVVNWSNLRFCSSLNSCTTSQKYLKKKKREYYDDFYVFIWVLTLCIIWIEHYLLEIPTDVYKP